MGPEAEVLAALDSPDAEEAEVEAEFSLDAGDVEEPKFSVLPQPARSAAHRVTAAMADTAFSYKLPSFVKFGLLLSVYGRNHTLPMLNTESVNC